MGKFNKILTGLGATLYLCGEIGYNSYDLKQINNPERICYLENRIDEAKEIAIITGTLGLMGLLLGYRKR